MKRTSKRYVITTSALNCYFFRILTKGLDLTQYEKNPITLWMHQRPRGLSKDEVLPLGNAVDLRLEGDQITCALEFDETDTFAMAIFNKYENGTLRMLSAGVIPLEWSEDPQLMVAGQIGPTVTKGKLFEVSCVDIGGNDDALPCALYNADENLIQLSDLTQNGLITLFNNLQITKKEDTPTMKLITLSADVQSAILLGLKLKETATDVEVQTAVQNLITLSTNQKNEITTLTTEKETIQGKLTKAEGDLAAQIKLSNKSKVDEAIKLNGTGNGGAGKFLPGAEADWRAALERDFDGTIKLLNSMPGSTTLAQTLQNQQGGGVWYAQLSYSQMDKAGTLVKLKAESLDAFKAKYLEHFGKEYKG
ncbi:hypothetical protein [Mucilaginibacter rubeus]|uniref:Uncharacterized protein n=1 Tax=Mucilaginibacter rubeus TaxID=2027860 RepID=A0A5C1I6B8_9SPHI|nr:hypothetical protein [Mucilaginibacter rubeus]QEM13473.1 hypothetical protein DEO27_026835 [Mucilaginibacter rubeus]